MLCPCLTFRDTIRKELFSKTICPLANGFKKNTASGKNRLLQKKTLNTSNLNGIRWFYRLVVGSPKIS